MPPITTDNDIVVGIATADTDEHSVVYARSNRTAMKSVRMLSARLLLLMLAAIDMRVHV